MKVAVRVRITTVPREREIDGVALDRFVLGAVRDVSPTVAAWLIAEGYAEPEMRRPLTNDFDFADTVKPVRAARNDRHPRRRSTDR